MSLSLNTGMQDNASAHMNSDMGRSVEAADRNMQSQASGAIIVEPNHKILSSA